MIDEAPIIDLHSDAYFMGQALREAYKARAAGEVPVGAVVTYEGRIIARYVGENPNGSRNLIAGITNERGNIVGLMPHPEHAIDSLTGPSADGLGFFTSVLKAMVK